MDLSFVRTGLSNRFFKGSSEWVALKGYALCHTRFKFSIPQPLRISSEI